MTTSPSPSSSPSALTVSRVGSPAGTITQTTWATGSCSTSASRLSTSLSVRVAVVADDGVPGAADPLAHVAAHLAEADQTELHAAPFAVCGSDGGRPDRCRAQAAAPAAGSGEQAQRHQQVAVGVVGARRPALACP